MLRLPNWSLFFSVDNPVANVEYSVYTVPDKHYLYIETATHNTSHTANRNNDSWIVRNGNRFPFESFINLANTVPDRQDCKVLLLERDELIVVPRATQAGVYDRFTFTGWLYKIDIE